MISDRLKELRISHNLTQVQVAEELGLKSKTYSTYECGTREPSAMLIKQIALYYGVSSDYILERPDNESNSTLKTDISKNSSNGILLSVHEEKVILAYRSNPKMQPAVDKLLGIEKVKNKAKENINISEYAQNIAAATGEEGINKSKIKEVNDFAAKIAELESKSE